jgi:nucleotide-binding universal stress UspA family protein
MDKKKVIAMLIGEAQVLAGSSVLMNPVGVVVAIVFIASIIIVLGWMLHLPKETESTRTVAQAVRSVSKLRRILVPLLNKSDVTDRIVALAAQMAQSRDGHIELLAVIEVPFMLPLNASVEEDQRQALALLNHAEEIARRYTTNLTKHLLKARFAGVAIVREAEERAIDMILIANSPTRVRSGMHQLDPTVEYVLRNAPCEVLLLSQGQSAVIVYNQIEVQEATESVR